MCDGCPCPYTDFLRAKDYYLNVLFPIMIIFNLIFIIVETVLIVNLRHKVRVLKFAILKKTLGKSEDLFRIYKSLTKSKELGTKSIQNRF